jgi:hemoglobin/transferrin/lactoferrin receptor protein
LCLSTFAFLNIQAQDNTTTDTTKNKSVTLNEVVISVNKIEETKKTVAQQVQVLTAKDIANSQAQTTADLISNAGIQVQKSQLGGGSPVIRGFEANRILLVIDGVRMNNLIYRSGHLQDIVKTDNNSLERVEILFGPASTVYGSDALGGVIHLYTKKPLLASGDQKSNIKVNVMSRYGSVDNELSEHLDFNYGTRKFASLTSFSFTKFDDLMGGKNQNPFYTKKYGERPYYVKRINDKDSLVKNSNRYLQVGSGYSQYDLVEKILFQQSEHVSHGLNIQYSNSSDVNRYDRLTDPKGAGLNSAEWYYGPQMRMLTAYDMNINNSEGTFQSIHFGLNYQALEESRHNRNFGSKFKNNRIENVGILGANLDFQKLIKDHNIRFGMDMQMNSLKSTANRENIILDTAGKLDTRFPDGKNSMNNFALYFAHTWKINEQVVLTDGVRAGYSLLHSTLVDTALLFHLPYTDIEQKTPVYSGSIGLIHSPSDDLKLSLLLSTGFRVPNVDDVTKIFGSAPGKVIVPNVDLKPEHTINYEIGITKIFSKKTRWENSIYYTTFKNIAVIDSFKLNGQSTIIYDGVKSQVYANQNKDAAYLYGFSSNLISQLDEHFMMTLGINYTYGRIKTDSSDAPLDHIPPFMARTSFTYVNNKFSSDFSINYSGAKKLKDYYLNGEDNEQYATAMGMPAWFTVNLRASYKACKTVTLQTGVDNIFDTQYRTFASGINAPGRNLFFAIRGNF